MFAEPQPALSREAEVLSQIRRCLAMMDDELRGYRVVLFGSRACATARPRSDFDLGVIGPKKLDPATFHRIADLLEDIPTLFAIDWVDLCDTSESFRREALRNAKVIYG